VVGSYFSSYPDAYLATRRDFDISDYKQTRKFLLAKKPHTIIHLAAMTNVDQCEKEPLLAYDTNLVGTYNIAKCAAEIDAHLIYVCTSGVFPGTGKRPYSIYRKPDPPSVYTRSKFLGEIVCQDIVKKLTIARTGWIFGGGKEDKKFVGMIVAQIKSGTKEIRAVSDVYGCPTYAKDLVGMLWQMQDKKTFGLFHITNTGQASRYDIAKEIVKILGKEISVSKASVKDFPSFNAPRPQFEVIKPNVKLRHWRSALKEYLEIWKKEI
jgi:dTDP-4-dehydrorhamnose reductase